MTDRPPPLPGSYESILSQARTAYRAGDVEGSVKSYRRLVDKLGRLSDKVLSRRPELKDLCLQASVELADLLGIEGRFGEAIEALEGRAASRPDAAHLLKREVAILRNTKGDTDTGMAELRALAEERPDDVWGWIILGSEARIEGRHAESLAALERALDVVQRDVDAEVLARVHYQRFLLMKEMKRLDDAVAAWEAAVDSHADAEEETVAELYGMLTEAGRYTEALGYVARDSNALRAGFQRGLVAYLTGNRRQARQEWQAVAALEPDQFDSGYDAWVEAVLRLGDPDPALEALQELLKHHGSPRLLILSGIGWAMRGDRELASGLFERAISMLRRSRPPRQKLDSADWRLLDSVVDNKELKATLKPYFAVVERIWG